MSEYINRNELLRTINENVAETHNERCSQILEAILNAPTADVVEVVRCRDCMHWDRDHISCPDDDTLADYAECFKLSDSIECIYCKSDDYCSFAERSENGT